MDDVLELDSQLATHEKELEVKDLLAELKMAKPGSPNATIVENNIKTILEDMAGQVLRVKYEHEKLLLGLKKLVLEPRSLQLLLQRPTWLDAWCRGEERRCAQLWGRLPDDLVERILSMRTRARARPPNVLRYYYFDEYAMAKGVGQTYVKFSRCSSVFYA